MHFNEFMASIVDSDLEDGEFQKLLTSPLYAQRAYGKPERLIHQMIIDLLGNRLHCFHQDVMKRDTNVEFCVRKRQSVEFEWNSVRRQ